MLNLNNLKSRLIRAVIALTLTMLLLSSNALRPVHSAAGVLDPTFDNEGKVTTDFGRVKSTHDIAIQGEGKTLTPGVTQNSAALGSLQPQFYNLPGGFIYALGLPKNVFDVTADGRLAVTLTNGTQQLAQDAFLRVFDPATGKQFVSVDVGFGPAEVRIANTATGTRVVVLTTEGGPHTVTIFDLAPSGILSQRARTRLTNSIVDFRSNLVLSSQDRIGFVIVSDELVGFSLDDGSILSRLPAGFTLGALGMQECFGRRTIVFARGLFPMNLVVIDATNPFQPTETGSVTLPRNMELSASGYGDILFGSDCRFVFLANEFMDFAAVDLLNLRVAGTFGSQFRLSRLKMVESASKRLIAMESSLTAGTNASNALLLLDATDPTNLRLVSRLDFLQLIGPSVIDFTFSRAGDRIFLATQDSFKILEVPSLRILSEVPLPALDPLEKSAHEIKSFGQPEKVLGAWGFFTATFGFLTVGSEFDLCLQDDSSGNLLQFNMTTGEYQFTNCSGFTISGTGSLTKRGSIITLQHTASDRRVMAKFDGGTNKATASIQMLSQGLSFTITDRNTANNTCACR